MKRFKKILLLFIAAFLLVLPISAKIVNAEEGKKVKVYVFEAGGCHWCEQEKQYLQGLESYGKKFEIVVKQLYVDNQTWAHGADYELGKKVADAFKKMGFEQARYDSTPFVVISDIYAAANYSVDLEKYIDEAYEKGDKDVVGCYANGGSNCFPGAEEKGISPDTWCLIIMGVFVVGIVVFVILSRRSTKEESDFEIERYVNEKRYAEEDKEEIPADEEEIEEPKKKAKTEKNTKKTTKSKTSTKTNKTSKPKNQKKQANK